MLIKRGRNVFFFVVLFLFYFIPSRTNGMGIPNDIVYDTLLKPILKKTLGHVKMNTNKHGFFHQYDFSTFSFSVPLVYKLVSVDNVVSFIEGLMHWSGHEGNLKSFFRGIKTDKYGSFFEKKMNYTFLEKYKNFTFSSSNSSCITALYSWYMQIKKSNFFFSYGLLYEYSKHVYSFDYYIFEYENDLFRKMRTAYDGFHTQSEFINLADEIIHKKYPNLQTDDIISQGDIKPNLDRGYDEIVEKYAKTYIKDKECRTLTEIYCKLDEGDKKIFIDDLKRNYIDYNARSNWEEANKSVSFCVNDIGAHVGISYLQNKIDPFYGFYFSMSLAAGIQYITCVNGVRIKNKAVKDDKFGYDDDDDEGGARLINFDNNCFAFLKHQYFYKNLLSFFIKIRLEAGYGLLRFFISFKSLDLQEIKKALEDEKKFELGEWKSAVRLEEYNEACYNSEKKLVAKFNIKNETGFKRFIPKIIQFGFTLNL